MRRRLLAEPVAGPLRFVVFVMYAVPLLWIILTSLKSPADVIGSQSSFLFEPTFDAYVTALQNVGLYTAMQQSLVIATGTMVLVLAIAIPAGYGLARVDSRITTVVLGLLIVLQMMPQTANVIPLFQLFGQWGLLDTNLGLIIADSALLTPFAILLLRPFFRSVPTALEEAAAIDGSSVVRTFFSVVLPLARNGIATTGTLIFLLAWGEFLYAVNFFLTPINYPLSALLASQVSAFGINWPGLMALAVITSIPILILFLFTYRLLREGLTLGAVK
ncbi:carbohydrate ABC transporter membrane protein 2 (CUT1 family) [Microcella alkaliphila]|uniref:Carbohydrate ABC transporter membrane protein 2 (CUT1 family) n=1 Tax=Microcella alkaliphila TaxID=279828 RepID=A0A4Q7U1N1_9MICO|nr:carbohydrate ABC transporter permease [Microcella alkaliphila]RZT66428.1 carbohydrate ABC transporter membrane protein 2 (CUT1 family) [Microcella alkaliphila]